MESRIIILSLILVASFASLPTINAEPTVAIVMEKTTYTYCERLFYIIEVSEVTGEHAIIHIRDESGKGSSAIPIEIKDLKNPVPSLIAFEKEVFPLGKYFVDIEYADSKTTAEFDLVDSDNICIPQVIKQFMIEWLNDKMPDGYLIDAFQKYVDVKLIEIPFEINDKNIHEIDVPDWIKNPAFWWAQGVISDKDFAQMISYSLDKNIISHSVAIGNEI